MMSDDLRVVILSSPVEARLARQINEWLETNKVEVVKITYQITSSGGDNHQRFLFSAMILYKQPK